MNIVTRRGFLARAGRLALAGLAPRTVAGPKLTLVREGHSHGAILIESGSPPAAEHGAQELQHFLREMSGAALPILVAADAARRPPSGPLITVGVGPLREEEYRVRVRLGRLEIKGGGKRGALYGCYALLEDVLGCRWYTSTIQHVPRRPTIVLGPLDIRGRPAFEYREPYYAEALDRDWAARNRTNGNSQRLDASVGGRVMYGRFVHTFNELVPPDQYFDAHPEYFSLIDGQRRKGYYQLCLTNADVLRLSTEKVRQWIRENPEATIFSVSQNDTYYNCQCDNCRAVEREEGAPSGVLLRFVNAVADAIGRDHPHVLIDTLAYQWSEDPPRHVRPRPNVRVRLAPIGACVGHAFDGCEANEHPYRNLRAWSAITSQLYLWHYSTNFAHYLQPLPDLAEIAADIPLVHRNGVVGLFYEGDYAPGGGGEMSALKAYLMAKLMWDPGRPAVPIVSEFLEGVYGPGAPFLQQWLDLLQAQVRRPGVHAHIYDPPTAPYLSDAVLQQGAQLFDAAERATQSHPVARDQVQRARLALEYVQLERAAPTDPNRAALARRVAEKIGRYGITQVREGEPVEKYLARISPKSPA
ncbi:MAG: DUF4838 domain-containing protein [Armatimonadetes bacterium]|nr:DUF4838 domain-containing protein [Armatimonadota bacterium]